MNDSLNAFGRDNVMFATQCLGRKSLNEFKRVLKTFKRGMEVTHHGR